MVETKYLVFARKWRPQTFEDVVGQEHITRTLQNAITSGRIAHAFLFVGSRGIGKTTTARILAKALNCLSSDAPTCHPCDTCDNCRSIAEGNNIDVIEIDGASNNSVDDVREIRENVRLVPSRSRYKVYIIDEVHQLSSGAFNALLKTIEEPPPHAIFILATTESHKVPATIISRCQRFDFRRVATDHIGGLLRTILDKEGVRCTDDALHAIARAAEGSIRDAESIVDQLVSYCSGEITFKDVFDVLGLVDWQVMHDLCDAIYEKAIAKQLHLVEGVVVAGKDLSQFVQDILRYFRNLLVCKTGDAKTLLALPDDEIARMQERASRFTLTALIRLVEQFAELTKGFDSQLAQRIALETLLIRLSKRAIEMSVDTVIEKIMQLSEGAAVLSPRPRVAPPSVPAVTRARKGDDERAPDHPIEENGLLQYDAEAPPPREARPALRRPTPVSGRVSEEEVRAALSDPHVAQVVDVFKGRIVDVKHDGKSTR
jgi:DNA polymerase-3 subunit gamma/tau